MNITDPIRVHARQSPDAPALVRLDGVIINYRQLDRSIDYVARRMLDLGVQAGHTGLINFAAPYKFVLVSLALARIGAAVAPASLGAARLDVCFIETETQALPAVRSIVVANDWFAPPATGVIVHPVNTHADGDALCVVLPSSGTTGMRKHVALTHAMFGNRIADKLKSRPMPADAREISSVGIGGGYGFRNIMCVLNVGGLMVFTPGLQHMAEAVDRHAVNFLVAPPSTLAALAEYRGPDAMPYATLRGVESGGSLMSPQLFALARSRICANILASYGSTEASVVATGAMSVLVGHPGAVGFVIDGVEVQAVDDNDRPLPPGTDGLLRIRGANCVSSYVDDTEASATSFRSGWFYPGDMGAVSAAGLMTVAGRASEIINSGGDKMAPQVIEDVLLGIVGVKDAAAFAMPNASGVNEVWAAIVAPAPIDDGMLRATCATRLRIMAPKTILRVESIPRNENGKIQRDALVRMARATTGTAHGNA